MSPYFALCFSSYSAGLAVAIVFAHYGPVAALSFLSMTGMFDES
jgi:hypothetical protein